MAGKSRRSKLVLSDEDRAELEQLSRSRTLPHREAQRAAIILGYYAGESIASIGRRLRMTRLSVSKWVAKALAVGPMAALKDSYHRPKEPAIGDDAKAWVVHVACSKPKDLGYAAEVWSRQALARHVREHAVQAGFPALSRAAKATVHRILAEQPLHPEKVKYYLERRDPEFGRENAPSPDCISGCGAAECKTSRWRDAFPRDHGFGRREAWSAGHRQYRARPAAGTRQTSQNGPRPRIREIRRLLHTGSPRSPGWPCHGACGGPPSQYRIHWPT